MDAFLSNDAGARMHLEKRGQLYHVPTWSNEILIQNQFWCCSLSNPNSYNHWPRPGLLDVPSEIWHEILCILFPMEVTKWHYIVEWSYKPKTFQNNGGKILGISNMIFVTSIYTLNSCFSGEIRTGSLVTISYDRIPVLNICLLPAKVKAIDRGIFDTLVSNYDASGFAAHMILHFQRG